MGNAFESTFSQVKEGKSKDVAIVTSRKVDKVSFENKKDVKNNKSTKQHDDMLLRQQSDMSTLKESQEELNSAELERKTFYLKPELAEMFKYAKFKKKIGESQIANIALENYFGEQFGKNWRILLK